MWATSDRCDEVLHFFFLIDNMTVDLLDQTITNPEVEAAKEIKSMDELQGGKLHEFVVTRKTAYFSDEKEFLESLNEITRILRKKKFQWSVVFFFLILICVIFFYWRARVVGKKMTRQIVNLYESLHYMVNTSKKGGRGGVLTYRPASAEVNELHLTFNKMAKTMMNSFEGEKCSEEKALLNLADTYNVFGEFEN